MEATDFKPVLYVKHGCPFSLKVRLFMLEAGLLDKVDVVQGQTPEEHQKLANMLSDRLGKASFPTAEIEAGILLWDSDALISHFAEKNRIDAERLPTYQAYVDSVFPHFLTLYRENAELKKTVS